MQMMRIGQSEKEEDGHTEKERIEEVQMLHIDKSCYQKNTRLNSSTLMPTGSTMNSGRL